MKFLCDRCKTRYSIADERVRGKILRIRCKKCSFVITVREAPSHLDPPAMGGNANATNEMPRGPSGGHGQSGGQPALQGALREAIGASARQDMRESEWYLAMNGQQEGPFALQDAAEWLRTKGGGVEVHVWTEGFDAWKPVTEVPCFRPLISTPPPSPFSGDEQTVLDAASPLARARSRSSSIATGHVASATSAQMETVPPVTAPKLFDSLPTQEVTSSMDLDIGEASRVVSLPLLMRQALQGGQMESASGDGQSAAPLPGVLGKAAGEKDSPSRATGNLGSGSGVQTALGGPVYTRLPASETEQHSTASSTPRRPRYLLPFLIGGSAFVGVAVMLIVMTSGTNSRDIVRGSVGGGGNLGHSYGTYQSKSTTAVEPLDETPVVTARRNGTGRRVQPRKPPQNLTSTMPATGGGDEVDLSGGLDDTAVGGPLDGSDLMQVYRKNQLAIRMCYERALKRDPLLRVPKTMVSISVRPDGTVAKVVAPALVGTDLGKCVTARIRRWKFRASSESFDSKFPVVFDQR